MADLASENLSASDIDKAADEVPAILAEIKCPSCNSSDESGYHSVDGVKNVKFCSSCNTVFGIDDTMNVNDLNQDVKKVGPFPSKWVCLLLLCRILKTQKFL